jgi:hypothetical protein
LVNSVQEKVSSMSAPGLFVGCYVDERGVLVAQGQVKTKGQTSAAVTLREGYPVEIMQLLDVLARIEARRQAKLRALRKDGE